MRFWKFPIIISLFFKEDVRKIVFLSLAIFINFVAALLEGVSFSFILLALSVLNNNSSGIFAFSPVVFHSFLSTLAERFASQQLFALFIIAAISLQVARSALSYLGQNAFTLLATRIQITAQAKVYQQILRFSFACVNRYKIGDLVEYAKIPTTLIHVLIDVLHRTIISALTVASLISMMMFLSVPLTLLATLLFCLLAFPQKIIIRKISKISQVLLDHVVEFSKYTIQNLMGLRLIHTFNRQANIMNKTSSALHAIVEASRKLALWNHVIEPINEITGVLLAGIFLVVGQFLMIENKELSLPLLLTFITIVYRLNGRIRALFLSASSIAANWGQITRLEDILYEKDKEFSLEAGGKIRSFEKEIVLHGVSLKYPHTHDFALQQLHAVIPRGSTIAFVGSSGAGKSSLMDLLLGLYHPTEGKITIDGVDLQKSDISSWRDLLGVVNQDTFVFHTTIEENIRFGKLDASFEEVTSAARLAGASEFVSRLPEGYQTIVGERGYRLSGGERQRIALARALIRNPEILILDEATSSLDSRSEQFIQEALHQFRGKKTIIVVAHRLSTIVDADQIYVLEQSKLVEKGSHLELIKKEGLYALFWSMQSEKKAKRLIK